MTALILAGVAASLALAVVGAAIMAQWFVVIVVHGESMCPTFQENDRLLVMRTRRHRRMSIAVFRPPRADTAGDRDFSEGAGVPAYFVKRIVAVAGDPVPVDLRGFLAETIVPEGSFVVRGDNSRSLGSHQLGYIAVDSLMGIVVKKLRSRPSRDR